jgi:hypothetical protein
VLIAQFKLVLAIAHAFPFCNPAACQNAFKIAGFGIIFGLLL